MMRLSAPKGSHYSITAGKRSAPAGGVRPQDGPQGGPTVVRGCGCACIGRWGPAAADSRTGSASWEGCCWTHGLLRGASRSPFAAVCGPVGPIHGMESRFHGVFPRFHGMFPADPWPVSCGKCGRLPYKLPSPLLKTPQNAAAARSVGRRRRGKRRFVRSIWAARACRNFLENCPSRPLARCRCGQPCPAPCAARRRAAAGPAGGVCRFLTRAGLIICGKCLILQALKR